jgi:hypothetical protein
MTGHKLSPFDVDISQEPDGHISGDLVYEGSAVNKQVLIPIGRKTGMLVHDYNNQKRVIGFALRHSFYRFYDNTKK